MDEIPIGLGDLERIATREAGGVVHQAVQASQLLFHVGEQALDLRHLLQVGLKNRRAAAFLRGATRVGFRAAIMDGDARALLRQAQRDAAPDALGRAGHQHDFRL